MREELGDETTDTYRAVQGLLKYGKYPPYAVECGKPT